MPKITPFLWFDDQAEAAATLYCSLFKNSRIGAVTRKGGPGPEGAAMVVNFELGGQAFIALNGGPTYRFTEAFSLQVSCEDQAEVDRLWDALCDGGEPGRCGWLKDRWGVSWQIVPAALPQLLGDPDPAKAQRAMTAMLGMNRLDIAALEAARDGEPSPA